MSKKLMSNGKYDKNADKKSLEDLGRNARMPLKLTKRRLSIQKVIEHLG